MNAPLRDLSGDSADHTQAATVADDAASDLTPAEAARWPDVAQPPRGRTTAIRSAEGHEGTAAFMERRKPSWAG